MSSKELRKSFSPTYFSIDDIIASQARVPCVANVNIKNFGFLSPNEESHDLASGSKIDIPIWAANAMITSTSTRRPFVTVNMPKYYTDHFCNAIQADPKVVDLSKLGPQYYQVGLQLCGILFEKDSEHVAEMLPQVLQIRILAMSDDYSLHRELKCTEDATGREIGHTLRHHFMDPLEVKLFTDAKEASEALDNWFRGRY